MHPTDASSEHFDLHLPTPFCRRIAAAFAGGAAWLERLPDLVAAYCRRWQITLEAPFADLSYNFVASGRSTEGRPVVLKLGVPRAELSCEIAALAHYAGSGAVRLLASDSAGGALLLERVLPGDTLATLVPDQDDRAITIAAELMRRLRRAPPASHSFPHLADWFAGLQRAQAGGFAPDLVAPAAALVPRLIGSSPGDRLLHGDLHHFNILQDGVSQWRVIDPKGLIGDPAYECAALLFNPLPDLLRMPAPRARFARRITLIAEQLGLERRRVHGYAFAHAVLSAWWSVEDGDSDGAYGLDCAELIGVPPDLVSPGL
jgi:streptomycin 6-kinase